MRPTEPPYTAQERLYLTKDGRVVKEDDPDRHELLAIAGGTLPAARARELGLYDPPAGASSPASPATRQAAPKPRKGKAETPAGEPDTAE